MFYYDFFQPITQLRLLTIASTSTNLDRVKLESTRIIKSAVRSTFGCEYSKSKTRRDREDQGSEIKDQRPKFENKRSEIKSSGTFFVGIVTTMTVMMLEQLMRTVRRGRGYGWGTVGYDVI